MSSTIGMLSGATLKRVAEMDAFVPIGTQTIYLRRQSRTLREAEYAGGPARLMLALVIWHEMAHIEGLDEYRCATSRRNSGASLSGAVALTKALGSLTFASSGPGNSCVTRT